MSLERAKDEPSASHNVRRKEGEKEKKSTKTLATVVDTSTPWPTTIDEIRTFLLSIQAPEKFFNPAYWLRIDQWLGSPTSQVFYFEELRKYLAWHESQNGHRKHKDCLKGFRNWLATCERWKERDAQRAQFRIR